MITVEYREQLDDLGDAIAIATAKPLETMDVEPGEVSMATQAYAIDRIDDMLRALRDLRADLDRELGEALRDQKRMVVEGLGMVESKWVPPSVTPDREAMAKAVYAYALEHRTLNAATGEIVGDGEAVREAFERCFRLEPRKTEMSRVLDWDQFVSTSGSGHYATRITRA